MAEPFIYKAEGSALWNAYCHRCKHRTTPAEQWPCSGCWNPGGDMYEFSPGEAEYASWRPVGVAPSDKVQMPEKARAGIEVLHRVVESLLTTSRYVDEEGEATQALADLSDCIADPPFRAHGVGASYDMQTGQDRPLPGHPRPAGVAACDEPYDAPTEKATVGRSAHGRRAAAGVMASEGDPDVPELIRTLRAWGAEAETKPNTELVGGLLIRAANAIEALAAGVKVPQVRLIGTACTSDPCEREQQCRKAGSCRAVDSWASLPKDGEWPCWECGRPEKEHVGAAMPCPSGGKRFFPGPKLTDGVQGTLKESGNG